MFDLIQLVQDWAPRDLERLIEQVQPADANVGENLKDGNALMDWNDVLELHRAGAVFGSHTRHHFNLKTLSKEHVEEEIASSKNDLETILQTPVKAFAFPGGHLTSQMREFLVRHGYTYAFSTERGFNSLEADSLRLRRINVWDGMLQDHRGRFSPGVFALNLMMAR